MNILPPELRAKIATDVHAFYVGAGRKGWHQGAYHGKRDGTACLCLSGAIIDKTEEATVGLRFQNDPSEEMLLAFAKHGLGLDFTERIDAERAIVGFNDYPQRTFKDVVDLCGRVSDALRAEAGMNE